MTNDTLAFGIDISRYNTSPDGRTKVNFDTIAAHDPEVVFIAMRAGISWGYQDPWFACYFKEAKRIGRVRLAYHVLYPGESPLAQMDNLFRIVGVIDFSRVPLVLDLELDHGQSKSRITHCTAESLSIIQKRTGRQPIIYSRAGWVNQYLQVADLPPVDWWLAQYRWPWPYPLYTPEHAVPPALPAGITSWLVHQTASRGQSIGAPAAHFMDYNRWNGDKAAVLKYVNQEVIQPIVCPINNLPCTGNIVEKDILSYRQAEWPQAISAHEAPFSGGAKRQGALARSPARVGRLPDTSCLIPLLTSSPISCLR